MVRRDEGFFSAKDNLQLFWETVRPDGDPTAWVGVIHGYGDHVGRYQAPMNALANAGFGVSGFDYRGHGKSEGRRGHLERFGDVVEDLVRFHERLRTDANGKKIFLLGHSHGGLMLLSYLLRKPEGVAGAILSSPYLALKLKPAKIKTVSAGLLSRLWPWMPIGTGIAMDALSRDEAWQRETANDALYGTKATPRWFVESGAAQASVLKAGAQITLPAYFFLGSEDGIAAAEVTRKYFESLASHDKQYKEYPGMRHETLNEVGKEEVWRDIARWISAHL